MKRALLFRDTQLAIVRVLSGALATLGAAGRFTQGARDLESLSGARAS